MKILALDDREDGRYLLGMMLKGNGHEVVGVPNGAVALEALKAGGFDLIISDILMPVMDGFQFCQKVKSEAAFRNIPFVFYTATYTEEQDEAFATSLGADRFIRKPCDPSEFMAAIRDIMNAAGHSKAETFVPPAAEETLKLYNERLVHKLEQKMLAAEQAAQELSVEKKKFQTLVVELPLGVIMIDQADRFIYMNPRFTELFGYTLADLPNVETWFEKAFPDVRQRENWAATWRKARKIGDYQPMNSLAVQIRCLHGATKQVCFRTSVIDSGGLIVTAEDVSEQVELEAKLRRSQKMEAIATLAGGIAHDFNNILAAVMGFAELAEQEIPTESPAARHIRGILPAVERARRLIRQILEFSQQAERERVPLPLHVVVNEVLGLLRSTLPATIEIRQNVAPEGLIFADPTQMHQVLMNLCTNAFQAMQEKGGILGIDLDRVILGHEQAERIRGLNAGSYLRLTVSDTGCGMPADVVARIYDPYFTTKADGKGTGLGLSVTHGIVESHHGAIEITSEPGIGTTFRVYFPSMENVTRERLKEPETELPKGQERILLVDDEPDLINLGQKMLEILGYKVVAKTSAVEALEEFKKDPHAFDLVITDLTMPHMTGYKLSMEIWRLRNNIPCILSSGALTGIDEETTAGGGVHEFIMKPFSMRDMAVLVRRVLDQSKSPR